MGNNTYSYSFLSTTITPSLTILLNPIHPPTTTMNHHPPTTMNHQPPTTTMNHHPPTTMNHQPPTTTTTNHHPPTTMNHHHPSPVMHIQHTADDSQDHRGGRHLRQHHNAQYNKHHAQESLTTHVTKLICAVFLSILFTVGLVAFILWLSLRPHRPRFYIHDFSIPSLAEPNGFSNARVMFNVTAQNPNLDIGIYYDTMNVTLYYQDQAIAETPLLYPFYQSPKNTMVVHGTLSGPTLRISYARWIQLLAARKRGPVPFRLDVASSIRFKVSAWDSRHHKMHTNCEIGVGSNGMLLESDKEKKCSVYFT